MNKHIRTKEAEAIRDTKSSSGYGGIVPRGLKPPGTKRFVSKPQYHPKASGIWGARDQ